MSREGPPAAKMVPMDKKTCIKLSDEGYTAKNSSSNFESMRGTVKVRTGKWFWEVRIMTGGLFQFGWGTSSFAPDTAGGKGVGDDAHSWAYDGSRQRKWNGSSASYGQYWNPGDFIGVALDLDAKKMEFFRNGHSLGIAFDNFTVGDGLYPAATLSGGQECKFNFGHKKYQHPHPNKKYMSLHCSLSAAEVEAINQIFNKYQAIGITMSESGETGDLIKGQGFLSYGQDLGVTEDTDPGLMLLAYQLGAKEQWEFAREEFINGWMVHGCSTIEAMKAKLNEWRGEIKNEDNFRSFYYFVFDYLKEKNKVIILMDEATTVWEMLGIPNKWQFWDKWLEFLKEHTSTKSVSKDTWRQFYDFFHTHEKGFSNYDEDGSWPLLFDEFVDWFKGQ